MAPRCCAVLACAVLASQMASLAVADSRAGCRTELQTWKPPLLGALAPAAATLTATAEEPAPGGRDLLSHSQAPPARHLMQSNNSSSGTTAQAAGPRAEATEALPPQPADADPAAATSDGGQLPIKVPPANITVVRTAEELQEATLSGAQDIEIRAHLDLRPLFLAPNPDIRGVETQINRKRLALLYASPPLRSIRGNCSDPGAVAALSLPPDTFPDLLPLKPRQCLLVVADTWLMVNSGSVWVDNMYLKVSRRLVRPSFTFITAGALNGELQWPNIKRSDIYVTATTFHGEHRGNTRGIIADYTGIMIYADGCIFTDWAGILSPITLKFQSMATIRNSVFRNMHLHVEIVDVSFEGIINFENVLLANVTLEHGLVASTTLNDYQQAIGFELTYYTDDDEEYDMELTIVKWGDSGDFGEDFKVINDTISDCLNLLLPPNVVLPGCSNRTAEARNRTIDRGFAATSDRQSSGVPFDDGDVVAPVPLAVPAGADAPFDFAYQIAGTPFDYDYPSEYTFRSGGISDLTDYEVIMSPELRFGVVIREEFMWLDQTRKALPALVPPPDPWPSFTRPPKPETERRSLLPEVVVPPPEVKAAMLGPLSEQPPPLSLSNVSNVSSVVYTSEAGDGRSDINVTALLLIITTEMLVVAALLWLWVSKGDALARMCECWRLPRLRRSWCRAWRRGQDGPGGTAQDAVRSGKEKVHPRGTETLAGGIEGLEAGHSTATQRPQSERNNMSLEVNWTCSNKPDDTLQSTDVSRGADITPASSMNPAYEYALPPHLALAAQCLPSLDGRSESDPGGTVVLTPYTINTQTSGSEYDVSDGCVHGQSESHRRGAASSCRTHAIDPWAQQQPLQPHQPQTGGSDAFVICTSTSGVEILRQDWDEEGGRDNAVNARGMPVLESQPAPPPLAPATDVTKRATDTMNSAQAATRLQRQLDSFSSSNLLLGKFEVLGPRQRRRGGQAVVQFVHSPGDRCEFAVKFFLDRASFLTEAALYAAAFPSVCSTVSPEVAAHGRAPVVGPAVPMAEVVSKFLPQVESVCDGAAGGLVDPRGRPLPPCIVMEKGESLQDLCDRAQPDLFTVFSVLSNVSRRLADMHAGGYVHRDLKPANVMWLPRQNRWTLIDFGCVARVGEEALLSFTLAYAAPEVVEAWREGRRSIQARPALDAWSLGVTAFELLTGAPAFNLVGRGRSAVVAMLEGRDTLPWEGHLSAEVKRRFGVFSRPVLQLLQRDPTRRSTLEAFHASCNHIFARASTTDSTQ